MPFSNEENLDARLESGSFDDALRDMLGEIVSSREPEVLPVCPSELELKKLLNDLRMANEKSDFFISKIISGERLSNFASRETAQIEVECFSQKLGATRQPDRIGLTLKNSPPMLYWECTERGRVVELAFVPFLSPLRNPRELRIPLAKVAPKLSLIHS